jgi:hypothetical protein
MIGLVIGAVFAVVSSAVLAIVFVRLARREDDDRKGRGPPPAVSRRR